MERESVRAVYPSSDLGLPSHGSGGKKWVCSFSEMAGEAGERLPLGKSVQLCAYLLFVGALAARLSDG